MKKPSQYHKSHGKQKFIENIDNNFPVNSANRKFRKEFHYIPLNRHQKEYYESMLDNVLTIGIGSAGTSKTYTACAFASEEMFYDNYDKIILCRANVSTGKSLGAFPGDVTEKLKVWLMNLISYLKEMNSSGAIDCWMKGDHPKLILEPIETIRGRSFNDAIIIVDEAQQLSLDEIKCITTRIGTNSKMILCGDIAQTDIKGPSGILKFINMVKKHNIDNIGITEFTNDDIVRSDIVRDLILMYEKEHD